MTGFLGADVQGDVIEKHMLLLKIYRINMSNKSEFSGNDTLVEILYKLKRLNKEGIIVDGFALAKRISTLEHSLIGALEEITGNRITPPMLDEEKAARIERFLNDLKMVPEIEQENWEYDLAFKHFCDEDKKRAPNEDPSKPPEGSGRIDIIFTVKPSLSLKRALMKNGFTFEKNTASGWSGEWLVELAEKIALEQGKIELPSRKGSFDPWR